MRNCGLRIADCGLKAMTYALFVVGIAQTVQGAEIVLTTMRGDITVRAVIDRDRVDLADELKLTLSVEGSGRVEVEPPRPLLSKTSAMAWRVRERGLPTVEKLDNGRSLWKQEFELSPFQGDSEKSVKVAIELAPLKVKAGNQAQTVVTIDKPAEIEIDKVETDGKPKDITGIEAVPPAPPQFTPRPRPAMLVGLAIAIVLIVAAFVLVIMRRKRPDEPKLTGAPRAMRDLANLRQKDALSLADFTRVADVLRRYLEDCYGIPASHMTSSEAVARLQQGGSAATFSTDLQALFERCDVAKFAGAKLDPGDCADCIDRALRLIEQSSNSNQPNAGVVDQA
jgi:hypothetical protein